MNREFLDWLSRRREPRRPFFAFLNYRRRPFALLAPAGGREPPRFARRAPTPICGSWPKAGREPTSGGFPGPARALARDAYDNCLAYLDARLGELVDELERRGVLDQTLVIVTADHGEGLGEHGLFDHGESLYRAGDPRAAGDRPARGPRRSPGRCRRVASASATSPRPSPASSGRGRSRRSRAGRCSPGSWRATPAAGAAADDDVVVLSELASPNPSDPNQGRSPAYRGPLISLAEGDFVYIRNEGDGGEELFNERDDPDELHPACAAAMGPSLRSLRERARRVTGRAGNLSDAGGRRLARWRDR